MVGRQQQATKHKPKSKSKPEFAVSGQVVSSQGVREQKAETKREDERGKRENGKIELI